MRRPTKFVLLVLILLVAGLGYFGVSLARHGFSAREAPSRAEEWLARHARRIATPAGARTLKHPFATTEASLAGARAHFVEHCATCHGLNGNGDTVFGRNMYPKVPDLRDQQTQQLADGELFYIISNGVRFTGMPAFGGEDSPEEIWALVPFLRHLTNLAPEELSAMKEMQAEAGRHAKGSEEQAEPAKPHSPAHPHRQPPSTKPHDH